MRRETPITVANRPHLVPDPDWVVPKSNKKIKQPEEKKSEQVIPKSHIDGVKLRDPSEILRDFQAKKTKSTPWTSATPPPAPLPRVVENLPKQPLNVLPDPIKGVLQSITDSMLLVQKNKNASLKLNKLKSSSASTSSSSSVRKSIHGSSSKLTAVNIVYNFNTGNETYLILNREAQRL
jgi:hypothetical protein